jgi:hypothetical protein
VRWLPADVSSLGACLPSAMGACAPPLLRLSARGRSRVRDALQSLLRRRRSLPLSRPRSPFEVLGSSSYRPTKSTLRRCHRRCKHVTGCPQLPASAITSRSWRLCSTARASKSFSHGDPQAVDAVRGRQYFCTVVTMRSRKAASGADERRSVAQSLVSCARARSPHPKPRSIRFCRAVARPSAPHAVPAQQWTRVPFGLIVRVCPFRSTRSFRALHR